MICREKDREGGLFEAAFFVVCPAVGDSSKRLSTAMCPAGVSGGGGCA